MGNDEIKRIQTAPTTPRRPGHSDQPHHRLLPGIRRTVEGAGPTPSPTGEYPSLGRRPPQGPGPADCQTAGVSLHPEARQLVESCPELVEGMAEIEFSVLSRCCLKQRIPDEETLEREVNPWCGSVTPPKQSSTGASTPRTPDPNFTGSIPSIPNMTDYWVTASNPRYSSGTSASVGGVALPTALCGSTGG